MKAETSNNRVSYFAQTDLKGEMVNFGIKESDRMGHVVVFGGIGLGKSALIENLATQDIQSGRGLAFLDLSEISANRLLHYVPENRAQDTFYFDLNDSENLPAFNFLEKVSRDKRRFLVSNLISFLSRSWSEIWSPRVEHLFFNTLLALMEYKDSTFFDLSRVLSDEEYRKDVVQSISDPAVRSFWLEDFEKHGDRYMAEASAAIRSKVDQMSQDSNMEQILGRLHSSFDIEEMIRGKKILIANLSSGKIGRQNAELLGAMLAARIYLAKMDQKEPFYLYIDEFVYFFNENFKEILTNSVKYGLGLVLGSSSLASLGDEARAVVLNNVGTLITFRVGASDAKILEKVFAPKFEVLDLINLPPQKIALILKIDGVSSKPFSATALPRLERPSISQKDKIVSFSRSKQVRPKEVPRQVLEKILQ